jgi:hypothetical protein
MMLAFAPLLACAVCYGQKGTPVVENMNVAILFMLAIVGAMFGGIMLFILRLRRQALRQRSTSPQVI